MQPITFLSTASAMVATVSAAVSVQETAFDLMSTFNTNKAYARVINRCDYDVHLWSVLKGQGCPSEGMVTLKKGEIYNENYRVSADNVTGVAIKVSKTESCNANDIVQLEYFIDRSETWGNNYLDVSYVDCLDDDCPTKQEGYYLQAGSQTGAATASAGNTWCPVLSCDDPVSCAKMSYILPDDTQTKTCGVDDSIDWYMCGGNAPDEDYESTPEAPESSAEHSSESSTKPTASSTEEAEHSAPAPTPSEDSTTEAEAEAVTIKAAAVTPAPENVNGGLTKTQVVYVTQYEYVNAKRHAHDHARRHQPFHA
jgi:hypothetical protein